MAKCSTDTCCLTLPLRLKMAGRPPRERFEIARQIYNTMVRAELKKLRAMEQSEPYKANQEKIQALDRKTQTDKQALKALYKERDKLLRDGGFSEYGFKSDIKNYYKHFNNNIGSNVAFHGIAPQVWAAFEKMLFKKKEKSPLQEKGDIHFARIFCNRESGGVEIIFRETYIEWKGLKLPLSFHRTISTKTQMLSYRVKYVRLLRKPGKRKDRWYAQLSLEGKPVIKYNPKTGEVRHPIGKGAVGLDIGPQTLVYSAAAGADLVELVNQVQNVEQEKRRLQRKLDRSRRATNPGNYADDGTIRRGIALTHNKSKRYLRTQQELKYLQHQQAEIRKRQHTELANHLLSLGDCFYVEKMVWTSLTHRAKETEISEKTGKIKRKKRFGKSVANKAPATLIGILQRKSAALGIPGVIEVPTSVKASQYNHQSGTYTPKPLSQRWNNMPDGERIQRDLYSAFLLQHYDPANKHFDANSLHQDYPQFVRNTITMRCCGCTQCQRPPPVWELKEAFVSAKVF